MEGVEEAVHWPIFQETQPTPLLMNQQHFAIACPSSFLILYFELVHCEPTTAFHCSPQVNLCPTVENHVVLDYSGGVHISKTRAGGWGCDIAPAIQRPLFCSKCPTPTPSRPLHYNHIVLCSITPQSFAAYLKYCTGFTGLCISVDKERETC